MQKLRGSKFIPLTSSKSVVFTLFPIFVEFSLNYSMSTFLFPCCEVKTAKDMPVPYMPVDPMMILLWCVFIISLPQSYAVFYLYGMHVCWQCCTVYLPHATTSPLPMQALLNMQTHTHTHCCKFLQNITFNTEVFPANFSELLTQLVKS